METTLYITIKAVVKATEEMNVQTLIDKFEQECDYNIIGCDDIKVVSTEYLETNISL